jgi:hypothetical protein
MAGMGWHVTPGTGSGRLQFLETAAAAAAAAGSSAAGSSAVRHLCARIGSPCLRQCVHGAPIGGGGGGGGQLSGASNISRYELPVHGGGALEITIVNLTTRGSDEVCGAPPGNRRR